MANPPYTDSSDFGAELKAFVDNNYKKPYKFNTNLYATFIKRCCEIIGEKGKVAMVHPPTFMYIKTFEDVRKYMIEKMHISLFVEWGYLGMFNPTARVDAAMYILENEKKVDFTHFIKLNDIYEGKRYDGFVEAYNSLLSNQPHKNNYTITQSKLKIIETMPFIYWISDGFRDKFKEKTIEHYLDAGGGLTSADNDRFLRFWWEVDFNSISQLYDDNIKWKMYCKGGPFNRWFGNNWTIVNWESDGEEIKNFKDEKGNLKATIRCEKFYFKEGITYAKAGSKGASFRYMPENYIFDSGSPGIFTRDFTNLNYVIAFLNSKLTSYILNCLNPTVSTQVGDIERVPFVIISEDIEDTVSTLASQNIGIKKNLCSYQIFETNFENTPLSIFKGNSLKDSLLAYLNDENAQLTQVLLNEAIINELIFEVYELSAEDRAQVEAKMGKPVGSLPVLAAAKEAFLEEIEMDNPTVTSFIEGLETVELETDERQRIKADFATLYQSNNDLEEFCIKNKLNPINVWYLFGETLPQGRAHDIALEFLADAFRSLLTDDEDGIIPLVGLPDEPKLLDRFEQYCLDKGFSSAQFSQLDSLLGRPVNEYIEHYFFQKFSDHLNLFMYLPKTPFIWQLSSGEHQGFEAYILIYKWNRDSLFKLKTQYLSKRQENLEFRQIQLAGNDSAQAQNEKERIRLQLQEIAEFTAKIDDLVADGYDPKLDDGVGKNIAPLQKRGLLRSEVLNKKQLDKYLKADW